MSTLGARLKLSAHDFMRQSLVGHRSTRVPLSRTKKRSEGIFFRQLIGRRVLQSHVAHRSALQLLTVDLDNGIGSFRLFGVLPRTRRYNSYPLLTFVHPSPWGRCARGQLLQILLEVCDRTLPITRHVHCCECARKGHCEPPSAVTGQISRTGPECTGCRSRFPIVLKRCSNTVRRARYRRSRRPTKTGQVHIFGLRILRPITCSFQESERHQSPPTPVSRLL